MIKRNYQYTDCVLDHLLADNGGLPRILKMTSLQHGIAFGKAWVGEPKTLRGSNLRPSREHGGAKNESETTSSERGNTSIGEPTAPDSSLFVGSGILPRSISGQNLIQSASQYRGEMPVPGSEVAELRKDFGALEKRLREAFEKRLQDMGEWYNKRFRSLQDQVSAQAEEIESLKKEAAAKLPTDTDDEPTLGAQVEESTRDDELLRNITGRQTTDTAATSSAVTTGSDVVAHSNNQSGSSSRSTPAGPSAAEIQEKSITDQEQTQSAEDAVDDSEDKRWISEGIDVPDYKKPEKQQRGSWNSSWEPQPELAQVEDEVVPVKRREETGWGSIAKRFAKSPTGPKDDETNDKRDGRKRPRSESQGETWPQSQTSEQDHKATKKQRQEQPSLEVQTPPQAQSQSETEQRPVAQSFKSLEGHWDAFDAHLPKDAEGAGLFKSSAAKDPEDPKHVKLPPFKAPDMTLRENRINLAFAPRVSPDKER